MREIKFRAWDKNNKAWCGKNLSITLSGGLVWSDCCEEVDENKLDIQLMQYTGLKDKNEKEIYEGDIVKCSDVEYSESIIFKNGCFVSDLNESKLTDFEMPDMVIVGNIYESPELLKDDDYGS